MALSDALPVWLTDLGWQGARENAVLAGALQILSNGTGLACLVCTVSGGIAFAQRVGVIDVPELEFQLALMREYLKDILGFDRDQRPK